MKIQALMVSDPITISAHASISEAIELMKINSIRHLPVVSKGNKLVGFITLADLKQGLIPSMLGDLNLAEPNALIGFTGPRVIEQTVKETLPEGFQRSEFLLAHGTLDMIVDRREMRDRMHNLLSILSRSNTSGTADRSTRAT